MSPCLLYVVWDYPILSETFIRREVEALRERGVSLRIWSIRAGRLLEAGSASEIAPPFPLSARQSHPITHKRIAMPPAGSDDACYPLPESQTDVHPDKPVGTFGCGLQTFRRCFFLSLCMQPHLWFSVFRRFRQWRPLWHAALASDHIHAHFAGVPSDMAQMAAQLSGRSWSCSVHARDVFTPSPRSLFVRLRKAEAVIACTQAGVASLQNAGIARDRILLIRHGIPLPAYPFHAAPGNKQVLAIGRCVPKKGFDTLLKAFAMLLNDPLYASNGLKIQGCPKLCLIGDGPLRKTLERQARRNGIRNHISFAGPCHTQQVQTHLRKASVLVLPSRRQPDGDRDGLANVLLEAMAMGIPFITTTAGSAPEVIIDGVHGMLIPPDDPLALIAAIRDIFKNPTAAASRAIRARQLVEQDFDIEKTIDPLAAYFKGKWPPETRPCRRFRNMRT